MKIISTLLFLSMLTTQQDDTQKIDPQTIENNNDTNNQARDLTPDFKHWLESYAKDPDSVKLKLITPARYKKVVLKRGLLGKKKWVGWIACYSFNAKNSYGAYTGYRPVAFMKTDDNRLLGWVDNQGNNNSYRSYERQIVEKYC